MTLSADGIALNTALPLIGLDPARGRVPKQQFDPVPPAGDPVEMFVSWSGTGAERRVPVEELMFDNRIGKTLPPGPWVYTGSTFVRTPKGDRFLAELDGVLIGMMRGPSPLIDNARADVAGGFGAILFNEKLGLASGTPVTLTIRALPR
ncbi:MAG: YdjY domain-containing protein [Vicinamibacterales bacterium]